MWNCEHCGCQAIAGGLSVCPQCYKQKEEEVAKITRDGGASNAAEADQVLPDEEEHQDDEAKPEPKPVEVVLPTARAKAAEPKPEAR